MDPSTSSCTQKPKQPTAESADHDRPGRTTCEPRHVATQTASRTAARQTGSGSAPAWTNYITRPQEQSWNSLPDLILKKIGLSSLEPNLARVSHKTNAAMSQELVYNRFILFALFDNDDPPLPVRESHFDPPQYLPLTHVERLRLQKDILECRWFTLDRYKQCLPTLIRLAVEREWGLHRRALQVGNCCNQPPLPAFDDWAGLKTFFHVAVPLQDRLSPLPKIPCPLFIPRRLANERNASGEYHLAVPWYYVVLSWHRRSDTVNLRPH
jgi:hypothetical protein